MSFASQKVDGEVTCGRAHGKRAALICRSWTDPQPRSSSRPSVYEWTKRGLARESEVAQAPVSQVVISQIKDVIDCEKYPILSTIKKKRKMLPIKLGCTPDCRMHLIAKILKCVCVGGKQGGP